MSTPITNAPVTPTQSNAPENREIGINTGEVENFNTAKFDAKVASFVEAAVDAASIDGYSVNVAVKDTGNGVVIKIQREPAFNAETGENPQNGLREIYLERVPEQGSDMTVTVTGPNTMPDAEIKGLVQTNTVRIGIDDLKFELNDGNLNIGFDTGDGKSKTLDELVNEGKPMGGGLTL